MYNSTHFQLFALLFLNVVGCGCVWYYYGAIANRAKLRIDNESRKIRLVACTLAFALAFGMVAWLLASPPARQIHSLNAVFYPNLILVQVFLACVTRDLKSADSHKTEAQV